MITGILHIIFLIDYFMRVKVPHPHTIVEYHDEETKKDISIYSSFFPIHTIPIFFLYLGIFLIIPYLSSVGLWRIYLIPWFALLFYSFYYHSFIILYKSRQLNESDPSIITSSISNTILFISFIISYGLIAAKMDLVYYFIKIPWSVIFIPLYVNLFVLPICVYFYVASFLGIDDLAELFCFSAWSLLGYFGVLPFAASIILLGLKLDGILNIYFIVVLSPITGTILSVIVLAITIVPIVLLCLCCACNDEDDCFGCCCSALQYVFCWSCMLCC